MVPLQASGGLSATTQSGPGQGGPIQRVRGPHRCLDGTIFSTRAGARGLRSGSVGASDDMQTPHQKMKSKLKSMNTQI